MVLEAHTQQPQPLELAHVGGGGGGGGHTTSGSSRGLVAAASLRRPATPITLDLLHTSSNNLSSHIELQEPCSLPLKRRRYLEGRKMSRRNGPKLDLKLNLSPPRANPRAESPTRSAALSSPTSPPSSCVSSELNQDEALRYSDSPEATSMMLVGCPRCLMYVMLAEEDPRCPKCKSSVLLDIFHENAATAVVTTTKEMRRS